MGFSKKNDGLKFETVPILVYCCFFLHNICEMRRNCEVDDQEDQAQIQRCKHSEEKIPNRPDEKTKIREMIEEYFEQNLLDAY